jgi:hypothetical protein
MEALALVGGFVVAMIALNVALRRRESDGRFDAKDPDAKPGLRLLFDFTTEGWGGDGLRQRRR